MEEIQITTCPECGEEIQWCDIIRTGRSGDSNFIEGDCICSNWQNRENGGDWDAFYRRPVNPYEDEYWECVE